MELDLAYQRMVEMPTLHRAERLARHYLSLAQTAHTLLALVEMTRGVPGPCRTTTECAQNLMDQIETAHERDLGLELRWPPNPVF